MQDFLWQQRYNSSGVSFYFSSLPQIDTFFKVSHILLTVGDCAVFEFFSRGLKMAELESKVTQPLIRFRKTLECLQ